jgi:tRNA (guanine37-N1)-methyltransferase
MALRIDILTLFPEMFDGLVSTSIVGRAILRGLIEVHCTNIRDYALDSYGTVDDAPFGGGPGMVLMCQPIFDAVRDIRDKTPQAGRGTTVLLTPQGRTLTQNRVKQLAATDRLILIAGHYEGFDERIRQNLADEEISLGDFVLSGGEVPAMAIVDAVARLQAGALGKDESVIEESFSQGLLEYPQYTRPREYEGMGVPEVLLSGDHGRIARWRHQQAQARTQQRRPDLWDAYQRRQDQDRNNGSTGKRE